MSIKVLIADDDEGMRLVLKKAVERSGGFVIAGEAEDGGAALRLFESERPGVVFLDVEMPVMSGIECAKRIADIDPRTVIIFATAHESYMPEAFEVYAFDYLIKPFRLQRLEQTLERIKSIGRFRHGAYENREQGSRDGEQNRPDKTAAPAGAPKKPNFHKKLIIRNKEGISIVDTKEIILIQREDKSTAVYTAQDRYITSESLGDIEQRLEGSEFMSCHKSYIININYIDRIYPYGRWTYIVKLKGTDKDALMTRESFEKLEEILE
ncbi:MAG TPA: LytTR family DNA-binding domain-containing protein [Clostridiales bacterium]|nr:LytTR family DNA-binding domain-containing protein [Clostridiales bacterium]